MAIFLDALAPLFGLILVGALMRRLDFPGDAFWPLAERLTYYVLFPAMLFYRLGNAHVPLKVLIETGGFMALMLTAMIACLLVVQALVRWHGPVFSSFFQGGLRFNAFVGLAAAEALLGDPLLPVFAVAMAIQIPLINLACIVMFLCAVGEGRTGAAGVLKAIARNPLIIGSVAGAFWGATGIGFHPLVGGMLEPLSGMTLPLGLLTVGAGLRVRALRGASMPFAASAGAKLLLFPLVTTGLIALTDVSPPIAQAAILLSALPAASSSYILARQLGGDAPLMAAIVSGETLLAMATMPLVLSLLR
ncbi:transporter [Tamilnaduibacter salinus]|uniref:Transporter n=2 Tax=Tamilnaduibacter salinus TaxID=1484056 RepID=A0A2A2I785_9GAMM|nr:AEC family transporter [Tamilnaduibacter salinus]PAV27452.1 transporter [Tamilnaduibacter salinus]